MIFFLSLVCFLEVFLLQFIYLISLPFQEVQLEGHWSHVNPVLAQVMQLLQKEPERQGPKPSPKRDSISEVSSDKSASVVVNEQGIVKYFFKLIVTLT